LRQGKRLIDNIAALKGNDYEPNYIVTNYQNWLAVLKTKPNDYSIPGGVIIDDFGQVNVLGIPLVVQNNMPAGTSSGSGYFNNATLIGDFNRAAIIQSEGFSVNFSEQDSDNVQRNLITALCESRVALAMLRLDSFIFI